MFLSSRSPFGQLMIRALAFIAAIVAARFVLELVGVPSDVTRFVSSTTGVLFVALYVAAVGPLRGGLRKFSELLLPALVLSAWSVVLVMIMTVIAAVLHLQRSHYAMEKDMGDWGHLGHHLMGHTMEWGVVFAVVLLLMAAVRFLWRWPITVAPGALLGAIVIMRFWTEAMGVEPWRAAAWSSTVVVFLSAFYLGGIGPRVGLTAPRALLVPSLVLAGAWRFWVYLATLLAAAAHFKTHFFDVTRGQVAMRLLTLLAGFVVEGLIVGVIVWGIAVWIARATREPSSAA